MFADYLAVDHDGTPKTSRDAFKLALISQLLSKFEFIYSINVINPKWLEHNLEHLFCQFLHFLYRGGLEEFENYEEPIPSGCVSVMTIHQSKGLEFPVTVVGSLAKTPRKAWWDFDSRRVEGTLKKFGETVARIENHQFSNAKVVKCARLCDGCDMRFYCNYK